MFGGQQAQENHSAAAAGVVALEVVLAPLQRVDVEEPLPVGGDRGGEAVVEHPLHAGRRTCRRRWPAAAASSTGSWRSTRRSRCRRGRAAARSRSPKPRRSAGSRRRRSGRSWRRPCRPSGGSSAASRSASPVSVARSTTPASRYSARTACPDSRSPRRTGRWSCRYAAAEAGVADQAVAALLDELAGQLAGSRRRRSPGTARPARSPRSGGRRARRAVPRNCSTRWSANRLATASRAEPPGPGCAGRDRRLDQVPGAVQLVAGREASHSAGRPVTWT